MKSFFCTTCEKDVQPDNVHQYYNFVIRYKINKFSFCKKTKYVFFKNLCICKRCFANYSNKKKEKKK